MKLFPGITLSLCLFCCGLKAQPKPLPDSIRLEYPDHHSIVTFELRRYAENKSIVQHFPVQLGDILGHIQRSLTEADQAKPHRVEVTYSEKEPEKYTLELHPTHNPETKITVSERTIVELLPPGWEVHVKMKDAEIHVYAPDLAQLTQLSELNMEPVITMQDKDPSTHVQQRFGLISRIILTEDDIQSSQTSHRIPNDMLGLHAGAGVGLVRDRFYPEFNFDLSLYLANRYRQNHQRISAHYELKLFTARSSEGSYLSHPASFLSLSYALNFRKDRPRWTGVGVGFLVHNRSDLFTGKTLKIFLETDIGSPKLNIIPELYLTDDYKQSVFGVKLKYKF